MVPTMRTTIDGAGRLVVPKALRDRLGLVGGSRVEITETPHGLSIVPLVEGPEVDERDGLLVIRGATGRVVTAAEVSKLRDEGRR